MVLQNFHLNDKLVLGKFTFELPIVVLVSILNPNATQMFPNAICPIESGKVAAGKDDSKC